ncbi:hypothetical protein TNCT_658701 [Trichonephila clavata]|uniref:Uncharacterized protein n=1 Tax=Trichonephila clavata TaxID=2740835 RepID=A0A8X6FWL0_TRICU|nr:hypothetical protein TNCT_658701 [Trichonephila clavata]
METLHYSSTTVTMAIRYNIQADDFGVFLLGFGTGMLIISGIAYTYVNRKSVVMVMLGRIKNSAKITIHSENKHCISSTDSSCS